MDDFDFPLEVVRTNRKRSMSIQLVGGLVQVRVPRTLPDKKIRDLIHRKTAWIKRKLQEQSARLLIPPREYVSGESYPYLSRNYRLKVLRADKTAAIKLRGGYLVATVSHTDPNPKATARSLLVSWYQENARKRLLPKTARLAEIIGVEPNSVTVKDYKSRWGSCSIRGDICYNWRIILAPHRIVDYVVVHELCHILEHNHSPRYWKHVEYHVPDYREIRTWLRTEAHCLFI